MTVLFPVQLPMMSTLAGTCNVTCDYIKYLNFPIKQFKIIKGNADTNPYIEIMPIVSAMDKHNYIKKDGSIYYLKNILLFFTPVHGFNDSYVQSEIHLRFYMNKEQYVVI